LYFYFQSFSDYNFGWAFYGIGQLRHSNNATGEIYGKKFKKTGVLGVFLDMDKVN
jgi:E3 ubiquitin-protein ligase NRDP1